MDKRKARTDTDWKRITRIVVTILAIAAAMIPAALALGAAWAVFKWAAGMSYSAGSVASSRLQDASAIADIVGALVAVIGFPFVWHQLRLQRQDSEKAALAKLLSLTLGGEFSNRLTWVLKQKPDYLRRETLTPKHRKYAYQVVDDLNIIASYVKAGLITRDMVFRMAGPKWLKAAEHLRFFIQDRRRKVGDEYWASNLDWLMEELKGMAQEEADAGEP